MLFTTRPATDEFYDLFDGAAANLLRGVDALVQLLARRSDPALDTGELATLKREGDAITHKVFQDINTTYFTPFARGHVYLLASDLNRVMDRLDKLAYLLILPGPSTPPGLPPEIGDMEQVFQAQAATTVEAVSRLRPNQDIVAFVAQWQDSMAGFWTEYDQLEERADQVRRRLLSRLARSEDGPLVTIRLYDIAEVLRSISTAFSQVAATLATIVFTANG